MLNQIRLTTIKGKEVKNFTHSSSGRNLIIIFTDGTFVHLHASYGGYDGDSEIEDVESSLDFYDFGYKKLIETEVITREEYEEHDKIQKEKIKDYQEKQDRRHLAKLLSKYPDMKPK